MKINKRFFLQSMVVIIALITIIACPSDTSDDSSDSDSSNNNNNGNGNGNNGDGGSSYYIVYGDNWHSDINTDALYFQSGETAPHIFTTSDEDGGANTAEGKVFKADFSGLTDGGWNGINAHLANGAEVDLSGFTTLSFYAKADSADTKIKEFLVVSDKGDGNNIKLIDTSFTTEWQQYIIPIFDGSFLSNTNVVFQLVHDFGAGNLGAVYLDEIVFHKTTPARPEPTSIAYDTKAIAVGVTGNASLPTVITLSYDNYTVLDNSKAAVTWSSSDESIVTVSGNSVTGVAAGSAQLTATLKGTTITGDAITVNVNAASDVGNNLYFFTDSQQNAVQLPDGWKHEEQYDGTLTVTYPATGGAEGTNEYMNLVGTGGGFAAGGWQGDPSTQTVDISRLYESLAFCAKSEAATKFKMGIQDTDEATNQFGIDIEVDISNAWKQYNIPLSDYAKGGEKLDTVNAIKYVLSGVTDNVDVDEVYLKGRKFLLTDNADNISYPNAAWQYYGGYDGTITVTDEAGEGADGTSGFTRLTGTGAQSWAAGGWGEAKEDLSVYESIVLWLKSDASTTLKLVLVEDNNASRVYTINGITTAWKKFTLALTTDNFADADFSIMKLIKYELPAKDAVIDIDEVYLVRK